MERLDGQQFLLLALERGEDAKWRRVASRILRLQISIDRSMTGGLTRAEALRGILIGLSISSLEKEKVDDIRCQVSRMWMHCPRMPCLPPAGTAFNNDVYIDGAGSSSNALRPISLAEFTNPGGLGDAFLEVFGDLEPSCGGSRAPLALAGGSASAVAQSRICSALARAASAAPAEEEDYSPEQDESCPMIRAFLEWDLGLSDRVRDRLLQRSSSSRDDSSESNSSVASETSASQVDASRSLQQLSLGVIALVDPLESPPSSLAGSRCPSPETVSI